MTNKEYTIKFYEQKSGGQARELENLTTWAWSNKDAYKDGRQELVRIARIDLDKIEDCDCSRYEDTIDSIKQLTAGTLNNYYYDQKTYFFKVFSKKIK